MVVIIDIYLLFFYFILFMHELCYVLMLIIGFLLIALNALTIGI